jgi:hypothetical protein
MKQDKRLLKLAGLLNEGTDLGEDETQFDGDDEETEIGQHELEDLGVTALDDPEAKYGKFGDEIFADTEQQRSSWNPSSKSWIDTLRYNESANKIAESKIRKLVQEEIKKLLK